MSQHHLEDLENKPEEKIFNIVMDTTQLDWKNLLQQLISSEGLDPWDIDLKILTGKYLELLKNVEHLDFNLSGKLLTIAVFLLKTKAEYLVEHDLRGMSEKIQEVSQVSNEDDLFDAFDMLESFDDELDSFDQETVKKEKYAIKVRNPLARKRKVNIFDLIKTLEKTFEQSNKRQVNFLQRKADLDVKYTGPSYERKKRDLKEIIEELFELISNEFSNKKAQVYFSHLTTGVEHRMGYLEKFIPLLHLHNQSRLEVFQDEHFGEIKIKQLEENGE